MQYILASRSPRRRELLSRIITNFSIVPADVEERIDTSLTPDGVVRALAESKCDAVFKTHPDCTVIGCDTIVVLDNKILGKPADREDAVKTLKALSGRVHHVITGVCVQRYGKKLIDSERTEVRFNNLSDEFIFSYVDGGSPMDKAGSYGIQDEGVVKDYKGSYTNVVGLPVTLVKNMLEEVQR